MSACGSGIVVEQSPSRPRVKGLSPAAASSTGRDEMAKNNVLNSEKAVKCYKTFVSLIYKFS